MKIFKKPTIITVFNQEKGERYTFQTYGETTEEALKQALVGMPYSSEHNLNDPDRDKE